MSLSALLEADGVRLHGRRDGERWGACPKCGGRDRFHVRWYGGQEWYFCRQCHPRRGDAIEYLRWSRGMSYREACDYLGRPVRPAAAARRTTAPVTARGVTIPDVLDEAPPTAWQDAMGDLVARCAERVPDWVADYLAGRGITEDVRRRWAIGYNPTAHKVAGQWWIERGITIPTRYAGALWRVNVRRRADDMQDGRGKYIAAQGSRAQLFNGDALADVGMRAALVCAGELDTVLAQAHAPAGLVCVTFGSESKRPTWELDYLTRDKRVLVAFDNDQAGEAYARAWAGLGERVRVPAGKDITDYYQQAGAAALRDWLAGLAE